MGALAAIGASLLAFGWYPLSGHPKVEQWRALILASVWVLAVLWQSKNGSRAWFWLIVWAAPIAVLFRDAYGISWLWLSTWLCVCLAFSKLEQASDWPRKGLLICGVLQVPLMALEMAGHPIWETIGTGYGGSLGRRYLLAALFGLCSLMTSGKKSWAFLLASFLTTSYQGFIPALLRLLARRHTWPLIPCIVGAFLYAEADLRRINVRLDVLQKAIPETWPPVGFGTLRGVGFLGDGLVDRLLNWVEYHNTFLEVWARFGVWGLVLVAFVSWLFVKRCSIWVCLWAFMLCMFQSVEAYPVAVWMLGLALVIGGKNGLDSIQETSCKTGGRSPDQQSLRGSFV